MAITCDGSTIRAYVDAAFRAATPVTPNVLTNAPLLLGTAAPGCAGFVGQLDELRIWNYARNPSELFYRFDCTVPPDTSTGLVGYWNFDEPGDHQVLWDASPSCLNGVLGPGIGVEANDAERFASTALLPCASVGVGDGPAVAAGRGLALGRAVPNPSAGGASLELVLDREARCDVRVYDVAGATVRRLVSGDLARGRHVLRWDGRSDRSAPAPPGLYFIRAIADGRVAARTVTLLH